MEHEPPADEQPAAAPGAAGAQNKNIKHRSV